MTRLMAMRSKTHVPSSNKGKSGRLLLTAKRLFVQQGGLFPRHFPPQPTRELFGTSALRSWPESWQARKLGIWVIRRWPLLEVVIDHVRWFLITFFTSYTARWQHDRGRGEAECPVVRRYFAPYECPLSI